MSSGAVSNVVDSDTLAKNSYRQMVNYLSNILARQIEKVRNYDLDGAMRLAEEANSVASRIGQNKILEMPEFADDKWRIKRMYKDLTLIIASEREEVQDKLKQIRKGIKVLGVYGSNV